MHIEKIRRDIIFRHSRVKDYIYRACLLFSGFSFLIEGIKSRSFFSEYSFISEIQFFPQGFRLFFYGILFFLYGFYLFLIRFLSVGSGFNEYDKKKKLITVFRLWYPGRNRRVIKQYSFSKLKSIVLKSKKMGAKSGIGCCKTFKIKLKLRINTQHLQGVQTLSV